MTRSPFETQQIRVVQLFFRQGCLAKRKLQITQTRSAKAPSLKLQSFCLHDQIGHTWCRLRAESADAYETEPRWPPYRQFHRWLTMVHNWIEWRPNSLGDLLVQFLNISTNFCCGSLLQISNVQNCSFPRLCSCFIQISNATGPSLVHCCH